MTTTHPTEIETDEIPFFRRYPVGTPVLWNGRAYSVIESREDGHVLEMIGKVPARRFSPVTDTLTPAP